MVKNRSATSTQCASSKSGLVEIDTSHVDRILGFLHKTRRVESRDCRIYRKHLSGVQHVCDIRYSLGNAKRKMKSIFLKYWPLFCIFSLWFLFSAPFFVQGRIPFAG